jgi:hypothetical protein
MVIANLIFTVRNGLKPVSKSYSGSHAKYGTVQYILMDSALLVVPNET